MNEDINSYTSDHLACKTLVDVMVANGVRNVVVSPGSRNAPLIVAVSRCEKLEKYIIVDERSAGFAALGMAQKSKSPVALICTSGTAVLNYAPAVAEAYYQKLPLIVISADRPLEWIEQNDSQTIRQYGVLSHIVKGSFDVPARYEGEELEWYMNRIINDAVITATKGACGPVHINVQLKEPLCGLTNSNGNSTRVVSFVEPKETLTEDVSRELAAKLSQSQKVMILATMDNGMCGDLQKELNDIAKHSNVVVLTETVANVHGDLFIPTIDRVLSAMPEERKEEYAPDLLIVIGGAPITRMMKRYLRKFATKEQWRVCKDNHLIDTMQHTTMSVDMEAAPFLHCINKYVEDSGKSEYSNLWHRLERVAKELHDRYVDNAPWCDLKAFSYILPMIPSNVDLQLSNGTSIRYAQLFNTPNICSCNCNRGVAGIDGSTSTALGASLVSENGTILITGDMSLSYDLNGLASQYNSSKFKIIVMSNGGGGIFRFINGPSDLDELEDYFEVHRDLPFDKYADAFGFKYYKAENQEELEQTLPLFLDSDCASMLVVKTPRHINAEILKGYFNTKRSLDRK